MYLFYSLAPSNQKYHTHSKSQAHSSTVSGTFWIFLFLRAEVARTFSHLKHPVLNSLSTGGSKPGAVCTALNVPRWNHYYDDKKPCFELFFKGDTLV